MRHGRRILLALAACGITVPVAADESIRKAADPLAVVRAREPLTSRCFKVAPLGRGAAPLDIAAAIDIPVVISSALIPRSASPPD